MTGFHHGDPYFPEEGNNGWIDSESEPEEDPTTIPIDDPASDPEEEPEEDPEEDPEEEDPEEDPEEEEPEGMDTDADEAEAEDGDIDTEDDLPSDEEMEDIPNDDIDDYEHEDTDNDSDYSEIYDPPQPTPAPIVRPSWPVPAPVADPPIPYHRLYVRGNVVMTRVPRKRVPMPRPDGVLSSVPFPRPPHSTYEHGQSSQAPPPPHTASAPMEHALRSMGTHLTQMDVQVRRVSHSMTNVWDNLQTNTYRHHSILEEQMAQQARITALETDMAALRRQVEEATRLFLEAMTSKTRSPDSR